MNFGQNLTYQGERGRGCGWVVKRKVLKACVTLRGEVDVLPVWFVTIF